VSVIGSVRGPHGVWGASTYNRGSYDSRYMGLIRISAGPFEASPAVAPLTWFRIMSAGAVGFVAWHVRCGQFP
jgi:hypothetical protein